MRVTESPGEPTARAAISSLSRADLNPYLSLFYESLAAAGVPSGPQASLRARWLLANRRAVRYLHVHWPEGLYRFARGPYALRAPLSWVKLIVLEARLRVARALGYRIVWTIHQVFPHDLQERLDRASARLLARHADLLLAHDPETAERARSELAPYAGVVHVIEHGSYVGVYPPGRPSTETRRTLGIPEDAVVFLSFGELRANSDVRTLLDAFARLSLDPASLIVAGNAKDARARSAVTQAVEADPRVVRIDGFVPADHVRELYDASDVAVVTRRDGGTSGSLILALSLAVPVVVPDKPAYRRLVADGAAGWLFRPGDSTDLGTALDAAAHDRSRAERGAAALRIAQALEWRLAAERVASLLPR